MLPTQENPGISLQPKDLPEVTILPEHVEMSFMGVQPCSNLSLHLVQMLLFIDGQDDKKKYVTYLSSVKDDYLWRLRGS